MGIISKEVELKWASKNKKWYESKGYTYTKYNEKFIVDIKDISNGSNAKVLVKCDICGKEKRMTYATYYKYNKEGIYHCHQCALKLNKKIQLENGLSFAQWGINTFGDDFLGRYWDYEKNKVTPYEISYGCKTYIWIKNQEVYDESFKIRCDNFIQNPTRGRHLNSILSLCPDVINVWSDKNSKPPCYYSPFSMKKVWWKCPEGKHKDYIRDIHNSTQYNFRCPFCNYSKGEAEIENYLLNNNIEFKSQIKFDGLFGTNGGRLSYDFYLKNFNILIEYQGEMHDKSVEYFGGNKQFLKQQEHDKRKREYADKHNIKLLEIWYWDFDNIEEILNREILCL